VSEQSLLRRVVEALDATGIGYLLSGSLASSLQGEPRATHDIDLVVDIRPADISCLVGALAGPGVYLDDHAVAEAVGHRSMFNLLDSTSGDKVDFWLLKDEAFDRERFARRLEVEAMGMRLKVSTPEDTILMKLLAEVRSRAEASSEPGEAGPA